MKEHNVPLPICNQRGSTLLVALIMLVLLTLIAVSAMNSTTASIRMVGNAQFREEALSVGQRAMEAVLSNGAFRAAVPANQLIDVNLDGISDYTVSFVDIPNGVNPPKCLSVQKANNTQIGYPTDDCDNSVDLPFACYWTVWDITANVTDPSSGANVILHQGVRTIVGEKAISTSC